MSTKKPCLHYAIHYLSRFPKSTAEMRLKLLEKGYTEAEIETTIVELKEHNYINDRVFVESYVHSDIVKKGKPIYTLKAKLLQKGIDADLIQEVFDECSADITAGMKRAIIKEIDKRKERGEDPVDIIQRLQRKGYHFTLIRKTIEERAAKREKTL